MRGNHVKYYGTLCAVIVIRTTRLNCTVFKSWVSLNNVLSYKLYIFYFVADKLNGMFLIIIHLKSNVLAQISSIENMGQGEFILGRVLNLTA